MCLCPAALVCHGRVSRALIAKFSLVRKADLLTCAFGVLQALLATDEYRKTASVTVVTFGSPAVGDEKWAENFDAKINARQLAYEGDGVAQVGSDAGYPVGQRAPYHILVYCMHHLAQHARTTRTEPIEPY